MIVALLSWYEESPAWLTETIDTLPKLGIEHLIALDGAYALYPDATPTSRIDQAKAIAEACERNGIEHTIRAPEEVWDSEVEKRTALFQLGEQITTPLDWYFVVDADELVQQAPLSVRWRLKQTPLDVAEVTMREPKEITGPARNYSWRRKQRYELRMFFRAVRGLHVETNHYTYVTGDGRRLWGQNRSSLEPALDLTDVEVFHRAEQRNSGRRADQLVYYNKRDRAKIEMGDCERCGKPAVKAEPFDWKPSDEGLTADYMNVCESCADQVKEEEAVRLRSFGIDPKTLMPDPKLAVKA